MAAYAWSASTASAAGDQATLPDGSTGSRIPGSPTTTRAQWDGTESSYWRRVNNRIGALELVPAFVFGDSWGNGGGDIDNGARYVDRLNVRQKFLSMTNFAAPGTRSDQILAVVEAQWVPNARGYVMIADGIINDAVQYVDASGTPTTAEAFRSMLALLTSSAKVAYIDPSFEFGPGWTLGSSSTVGSYGDLGFTGDAVWLRVGFVTGAGGTLVVKNAAGTTLATITTGGYKQNFTGSVKLSGFGAGAHTVRFTVTAGTVAVIGAVFPSANPPLISWLVAGSRGSSAGGDSLLPTYEAAVSAVVAGFPTVVPTVNDGFWSATTMTGPSNHPNDLGMYYIANLTERSLIGYLHTQGLNQLSIDGTASTVYSGTTPAYQGPGATAPAQVTGLSATTASQVTLAWTQPTDGGATITSYKIQFSTDNATWSDLATAGATATSYTVASGLTQSTTYFFRVAAINGVGTGTYSASASCAAGAVTATYVADDFNRATTTAPTVGASSVGSITPTQPVGGYSINSSQQLSGNPSSNPGDCLWDSGAADGTIQVTRRTPNGRVGGLAFRVASTTSGFIFFENNSGVYQLSQRTAVATYTILVTTATTAVINDVIKVILFGTSIKCYVNGVKVVDTTSAVNQTTTKHGVWTQSPSTIGIYDDYSHTSATA